MPATKKILAFDLGAESGRGLLGLFDGRKLALEVLHRFPNGPVQTLDTMHWDVLRLYGEMLAAMRKAAEHGDIAGVGVDTWGVDFALLASFGLPERMLGTLVQPGTVLGPLRPAVAQATGLPPIPVIAPATHDTAAAVAAVPAQGQSWAYISSGTWSLMGVEIPGPLV